MVIFNKVITCKNFLIQSLSNSWFNHNFAEITYILYTLFTKIAETNSTKKKIITVWFEDVHMQGINPKIPFRQTSQPHISVSYYIFVLLHMIRKIARI